MVYILLFFAAIFIILLVFWAGGMALGIVFGRAPYILSARGIGEIINQELSEVKSESRVYELGSGNGHILKKISEKRSDLKLVGYEISPYAYLMSRIRLFTTKNVTVQYGNFFAKKLEQPAAIYFYLLPEIYPKLIAYFRENVAPGTLILAIEFSFGHLVVPELTLLRKVYFKNQRVYIYRWG